MPKKYLTSSITTDVVNPTTGEVVETTVKKIHRVSLTEEDHFYMTFFTALAPYYGLKYADDLKLITKLCELAQWNTGVVLLPTQVREQVCIDLSIHTSNLSKCLKRLVESELISGGKGAYTINPKIFWRGDKQSRDQLLKNGGVEVLIQFDKE